MLTRMSAKFSELCLVLLTIATIGNAGAQQLASTSGIQTIDHIVAVVNETVVTRHELDEVLKATVRQLQKQGVQPPAQSVLEKQLLERLILNRVQLQLAKE